VCRIISRDNIQFIMHTCCVTNSYACGYNKCVNPVLQTFISTMYESINIIQMSVWNPQCMLLSCSHCSSVELSSFQRGVPYCYPFSVIQVALMFVIHKPFTCSLVFCGVPFPGLFEGKTITASKFKFVPESLAFH